MRDSDWSSDVALPIWGDRRPCDVEMHHRHGRNPAVSLTGALEVARPEGQRSRRCVRYGGHHVGAAGGRYEDLALPVLAVKAVDDPAFFDDVVEQPRSEEHTSELQSLMRISYAVFCLQKQIKYDHQLNLE